MDLRRFEETQKLIDEMKIALQVNKKPEPQKEPEDKFWESHMEAPFEERRKSSIHVMGNSNAKMRRKEEIKRQLEGL